MNRMDFIKVVLILIAGIMLFQCSEQQKGVNSSNNKIKIVLLGFDGANWATIDPLIEKGKLPYLKELKRNSAWADFKTFKPAKSNVVWTSIATGKSMLKHGIVDFTYLRNNKIRVPYNKSNRKEPTIWQITDLYKKKSIVVNWWVSHPPDKINGVMVSDYMRLALTKAPDQIRKFRKAVHPQVYFDKLIPFMDRDYKKVLEKTGLPDFQKKFHEKYPKGNIKRNPLVNSYSLFAKQDSFVEESSKFLYANEDFDMFATYFRFPDVIQHFITLMMDKDFKKRLIAEMKKGEISNEMRLEATNMISDILEPIYTYMEKIIKSYLESPKYKNTYFFIMSDHGFSLYPGGYNHYGLPNTYNAPDGILLIKGPNTKKGKIRNAGVLDIAPTMLYLQDLPVGKNMDGKVLKSAFTLKNKIRYRAYKLKKGNAESMGKDSYSTDTMKDLKTLGYIGDKN